jgi:hypothetical protein
MPKPVLSCTSSDLSLIARYEQGEFRSAVELAQVMGRNEGTVRSWLKLFGIKRRGYKTRASELHKARMAEPKCKRCEILLKYAENGHKGGLCAECIEDLAHLADREWRNRTADAALVAYEDVTQQQKESAI